MGGIKIEYTKDQFLGDLVTAETFEGTPEEIIKLIKELDKGESEEQAELPEYDQEEAVEFIKEGLAGKWHHPASETVKDILDLDEDYMRSKGIIED